MSSLYPGFNPKNPYNDLKTVLQVGPPITNAQANEISKLTKISVKRILEMNGRRTINDQEVRKVLETCLDNGKFTTYLDIANKLRNPSPQKVGQVLREAKDMHSLGGRVIPANGFLKRRNVYRVKNDDSFELREQGAKDTIVGKGFRERIEILEREGLLDLSAPGSHDFDEKTQTITAIYLDKKDHDDLT